MSQISKATNYTLTNFDKVRIVMVSTTEPGNIGAAARAMKNMSLSRLELALGFVMGIKEIDKIVIGVNTVAQLQARDGQNPRIL